MLKNLSKKRGKKKGFTLIELIVVLAVLAIIALIAIPNFNQIRENSKVKSDDNSAVLIEKAVDMLIADDTIKVGIPEASAYIYTPGVSVAPTDVKTPEYAIYESIKGTEAPQSKTGATKNDSWKITVVTDPNTTGGLKAEVKAIVKSTPQP